MTDYFWQVAAGLTVVLVIGATRAVRQRLVRPKMGWTNTKIDRA